MARIAFVSTLDSVPWGGSEALWSQAAAHLARRGVAVDANVWRWPDLAPPLQELQAAGGRIAQRRTLRRLDPLLGGLFARRVCRWLDAIRPDLLVIAQSYHTQGAEWMQACATRKIPYALLVQAAGEYAWPHDADAQRLAQGFEGARACFFVSEGNLAFVRRQLATPIPKARVVRNPFHVSYEAAPPWPPDTGVYRLACIGRLQSMAKGQDLLLEVLRSPQWQARALQVTLYGQGPNEATLRRLAQMYGLSAVRFGGYRADIEGLWGEHHGLVLPSRFEGLPLVVVEAMLCGRPCIVTDVAGNAELIEDGVSGFVASGPTVALLDAALERAWERRGEWGAIGEAAARRVREMVPRDPAAVFAEEIVKLI